MHPSAKDETSVACAASHRLIPKALRGLFESSICDVGNVNVNAIPASVAKLVKGITNKSTPSEI